MQGRTVATGAYCMAVALFSHRCLLVVWRDWNVIFVVCTYMIVVGTCVTNNGMKRGVAFTLQLGFVW